MKRVLATLCTVLLLFCAAAGTAFALPANDKSEYVPIVPEFLTVSGGTVRINTKYDTESATAKAFFSDFYDYPYLIIVSQETYNDYIPPVKPGIGSSIKQVYVGEDKRWSLTFLKIKVNSFYFTVADPDSSAADAIRSHPVRFHHPTGTVEQLTYRYDYSKKTFGPASRSTSSTVWLSYVIGSSPVSPIQYDYNKEIGTLYSEDRKREAGFEIGNTLGSAPNLPLYYYNWWLAKKNITNDFKPDPPTSSDVSSDSGGSSSGSSGGSSSGSGGSSSGGGSSSDSGGSSSSGSGSSSNGGSSSSPGGSSEDNCPCPCPDCSGSVSSGTSSGGGSGGGSSSDSTGTGGGSSSGGSAWNPGEPGGSPWDFPIFDPDDYPHTELPFDGFDPYAGIPSVSYPLYDFSLPSDPGGGIYWQPVGTAFRPKQKRRLF